MTQQQLKRSLLDPCKIGLMRLKEMSVSDSRFTKESIIHIGKCSINRKYIIVGRVGNDWVVVDYAREKVHDFKGHGYVIKGKKVIPLQHNKRGSIEGLMDAYECAERSKPIGKMTADDIFNACKGTRTRKHGQRGGAGFAEYSKSVVCTTVEKHRPWQRGERVKMRNANKHMRECEDRQMQAASVIKFAKYGLIYKSNPCPTK